MTASDYVFRIHPAIGFTRVGNSEAYYLAPETIAGLNVSADSMTTGGLPIRPGTESDTIDSNDLRDHNGALKRQGVRFRIFQYERAQAAAYPSGPGIEIKRGSMIDGKRIIDIVWTAHVANKKANSYVFNGDLGLALYEKPNASQLTVRNPSEGSDLGSATRLKRLVIDPGPRAIRGAVSPSVSFDQPTPASYCDASGQIRTLNYPKSFPDGSFAPLYTPNGNIDSLGSIQTDQDGRLIVLGGYGRACAWYQSNGKPYPIASGQIAPGVIADLNEDGWFDDAADGPVSAVLLLEDGSVQTVQSAWVVVAPPSFAPQILNVVSLWDDVYDTWVRKLGLCPEIFRNEFQEGYEPCFDTDVYPIFRATALQRWNTNLPQLAIDAHDAVGDIRASDDPAETILAGLAYVRDPNNPQLFFNSTPFMPLAIGDAGKSFLAVTLTQYFFLKQWNKQRYRQAGAPQPGFGELLDKVALANCMGGAFGPGLELTFVVRDAELYRSDWRETGSGPFRIRARHLDYGAVQPSQPFLTVGYVPFHAGPGSVSPAPLEPGDLSKFMSLPWHTDFNACATHNADPNPRQSTTLYWAWPAQRPMQIHRAKDVRGDILGQQRYAVRGKDTYSDDLGLIGRFPYEDTFNIIVSWTRMGTVLQGSAIAGSTIYSPLQYLEVASQFDEPLMPPEGPIIKPWPMNSNTPDE